jgi:hypothetical protein
VASQDVLVELERWYLDQCDEDWEHSFGVAIDTLDNPGWQVRVDLVETALSASEYKRVETHRTEQDWIVTWRDETQWHAACGPQNLREALDQFLTWARR